MSHETLLSSAQVRAELGGVSLMTLHRWINAGILPTPVKIRNRNYWRRSTVDAIKRGDASAQA